MADGLIPYGHYAGVPCLEVAWSEVNPQNASSLANLAHRSIRPGQRLVRLTGDVPWGDLMVDRLLMEFMDDPRLESANIWCLRDCADEAWSTVPVWNVVDLSACFESQPVKELVRRMDSLPLMPRPAELLVFEPAAKALTEGLLDELFGRLDPDSAWIYTSDSATFDKAERVVARAIPGWGVRWNNA